MKLIPLSFMAKYILLLLLLSLSRTVSAVEVTDLYQAKVPVTSQAEAQRNRALAQAMRAVIVKVGGQASALDNKVIKQELAKYRQYLEQYSYEKNAGASVLLASFNENKINRLFQKANLPIWGNLRPQILLWLLDEQGLERQVISESTPSVLPQVIRDISSAKGLPIRLPLMDLTDIEQIAVADLWGRFAEPVKLASARYRAEASVIVRLSDSSLLQTATEAQSGECQTPCMAGNYALDWSLITEQQTFGQRYQGSDKVALLRQALNDITEVIYQSYALNTSNSNEMLLDVNNVRDLTQYVDINEFLLGLSSVKAVTLVAAQGSSRRFRLSLLGSPKSLLSSLKLNKQLQQIIDPLAQVQPDAVPVFSWRQP